MTVYSPSRLDTFRKCQLQYKFHYIDKIEVEEVQGIEMFMGSLVHEVLEQHYKDLELSKPKSLEDLLKYFRESWEKNWTDDIRIMKKGFTRKNYLETGEKCLQDYYLRYQPFKDRTIGLELNVSAPLDKEEDINISGYIDRLAEPEDGIFEIHDYKTGAWLRKPKDLKGDRQLSLYQIAVEHTWPKAKKVRLIWHYLAFDKELSIIRSRKEVEEIRRETVDLIKQIENTKDFYPNKSGLCGWCDYLEICSAR